MDEQSDMMTAGEVARMFRVDAKTVARWVAAHKLPAVRTPGGQLRFHRAEVEKFLRTAARP